MTDEEYSNIQASLMWIGHAVIDLDLVGFLKRIDHADAVGSLLDPTLYHQAIGNLMKIRSLAAALLTFQVEIKKQLDTLSER